MHLSIQIHQRYYRKSTSPEILQSLPSQTHKRRQQKLFYPPYHAKITTKCKVFATIQQSSCLQNHLYLAQMFNLKCCKHAVTTLLLDQPFRSSRRLKGQQRHFITQFKALKSRSSSFTAAFPHKYIANSLSPHPFPPATSPTTKHVEAAAFSHKYIAKSLFSHPVYQQFLQQFTCCYQTQPSERINSPQAVSIHVSITQT